jgi:hypothetical protein
MSVVDKTFCPQLIRLVAREDFIHVTSSYWYIKPIKYCSQMFHFGMLFADAQMLTAEM